MKSRSRITFEKPIKSIKTKTKFLSDDESEWNSSEEALAHNCQLKAQKGDAFFFTVLEGFSLEREWGEQCNLEAERLFFLALIKNKMAVKRFYKILNGESV